MGVDTLQYVVLLYNLHKNVSQDYALVTHRQGLGEVDNDCIAAFTKISASCEAIARLNDLDPCL